MKIFKPAIIVVIIAAISVWIKSILFAKPKYIVTYTKRYDR